MENLDFLEAHENEIRGLYRDSYYKMGGWNGLVMAVSEVQRRYNFKKEITSEEIEKVF